MTKEERKEKKETWGELRRRAGADDERARQIVESFSQAVRQMVQNVLASWKALADQVGREIRALLVPPPGTFMGDFLAVYDRGDAEALDRLSKSKYFCQRAIIYKDRWFPYLDNAFAEYRGDRRWDTAWTELVAPNLLVAIREVPDETSIDQLYRKLRRLVRPKIERSLLDGETDDDFRRHPTEPWPEEDTPEATRLEEAYQRELDDWWTQVENRVDAQRVLETLDPQTRQVLEMHSRDGLSLKEAVLIMGLEYNPFKQRLYRLRKRQRKR
jgi:hypothetical protein